MLKPLALCVIALSLGFASAAFGQDGADDGDDEMEASPDFADDSDAAPDEDAAPEESEDVAVEADAAEDELEAADESGDAVAADMEGEQESSEDKSVANEETDDDTGDGADVEPGDVTDPQNVSTAPNASTPAPTPTIVTPAPVPTAPQAVSVPSHGSGEGCAGRCVGTVRFWNEAKGFGLITMNGQDFFFSAAGLNGVTVREKDRVNFEVIDGKKGLNAVKINKN